MSIGRQILGLLFFLALSFCAAGIGGLFTAPAIPEWYANLPKPAWTPPNAVFGPVWSLLYLLMALAAWLVWRRQGWHAASMPLSLFVVQLALNAAWSVIFFGLHLTGLAFAEIIVLWVGILATMIAFWRRVALAGWLFLPYLLWVTFASVLTYAIWRG